MPTNLKALAIENVPPGEPQQIDHVADLTVQQLERRYGAAPRFLRGVHPKDHGCVEASFTVLKDLPKPFRVGLFRPGARFRSVVRFSNAAPLVTPDSLELGPDGKPAVAHGSRGMAIKLYGISGNRLVNRDGESTQDFLMINQPVFAFANVEDYAALSEIITPDERLAPRFFERMKSPDEAVRTRAAKTLGIVQLIKSLTCPPSFQPPPLSPLDNRYFSAAPFMFGKDRVMKFAATPVAPVVGELGDIAKSPNYLRDALRQRMAKAEGKDICFDFQVQVRRIDSLAGRIDSDIEDVCTLWDEAEFPFVTVARIAIPPQDVSAPERQELCESLFYTPWHGLMDFRPIGGINRLRRQVYETSAKRRGCPVSPELSGGG